MNDITNLPPIAPEFDVAVLLNLVDSDPEMFKKFALMFIRSFETALANIDMALEMSDLVALCAMGHRAKSTARNIGAMGLGRECELLETSSNKANREEATRVALGLRPMFEAVRTELSSRIDPSGHGL
jgi:HPt (histidine-containing phosphotransfer) domain-containing protein